MKKKKDVKGEFKERRASHRTLIDRFYSVEFEIVKGAPSYQFKLRDLSEGGLCIAVRRDSAILSHLKVGDVHHLRYAPSNAPTQEIDILTKIRHITRCREGPYKDHYLVGLSTVDDEKPV
jgi:hypothetical protein